LPSTADGTSTSAIASPKTRRVLPGLRHEVHNEPEGLDVVDGIAAWLRSTLGHAP
jgi:alpha-beta hydrolase superfamily lysophospholipase